MSAIVSVAWFWVLFVVVFVGFVCLGWGLFFCLVWGYFYFF